MHWDFFYFLQKIRIPLLLKKHIFFIFLIIIRKRTNNSFKLKKIPLGIQWLPKFRCGCHVKVHRLRLAYGTIEFYWSNHHRFHPKCIQVAFNNFSSSCMCNLCLFTSSRTQDDVLDDWAHVFQKQALTEGVHCTID